MLADLQSAHGTDKAATATSAPAIKRALSAGDSETPVKKTRAVSRPAGEVADDVRGAFLAIKSLGKSLRSVFHKLDSEHTGRVSIRDFGASLASMGLELSADDLGKLAVLLHAEHDDFVSYERLLAFVGHTAPAALTGPTRRRKRRQLTASIGLPAGSGAGGASAAASASSRGQAVKNDAIKPEAAAVGGQPSLGNAFAWLDAIASPEEAVEAREDARDVIMAAAEAAAEAMAKSAPGRDAWVAASDPGAASVVESSRKRPVSDQEPVHIPSAAFGQAAEPSSSGFGFGMTLGGEERRWSEAAGAERRKESGAEPPRSRRARLDTDEDVEGTAAQAAAADAPAADTGTARRATEAAAASAAASGSPLRGVAARAGVSGAGASGPASLGEFTVISRGLAAVAKLGSAGIVRGGTLTAAKILVLQADPIIRRMVWEFLQTSDEEQLAASIARIALSIAGDEEEAEARGGEAEFKAADE